MKLLFRQRLFSWFDSYDIYNEYGETVYTVRGQLSWGHCLHIEDASGRHVGTVKERVLTLLPKFEMYENEPLFQMYVFVRTEQYFNIDALNIVETENNKWIVHNTKSSTVGSTVGLIIDPEAIHIMRKVESDEK